MNYTYDGDGLRVEKSSGTLYWRSVTGRVPHPLCSLQRVRLWLRFFGPLALPAGQVGQFFGGSFCSSLGYAVWGILNNAGAAAEQFNAVGNALSEKLHIPLAMAITILNVDINAGLIYLQGGNLNFEISGTSEMILCSGPGGCRLDNGLHIHSVGGVWYVHLDTVDPFKSIGDFFEHGFVDLFLGNVAYTITPRPW